MRRLAGSALVAIGGLGRSRLVCFASVLLRAVELTVRQWSERYRTTTALTIRLPYRRAWRPSIFRWAWRLAIFRGYGGPRHRIRTRLHAKRERNHRDRLACRFGQRLCRCGDRSSDRADSPGCERAARIDPISIISGAAERNRSANSARLRTNHGHASPCGPWPDNVARNFNNQHYANFGCATQNNLAAMIANPLDLLYPRVMPPPNAARRGDVLQNYQNGHATDTDYPADFGGGIAAVGQ